MLTTDKQKSPYNEVRLTFCPVCGMDAEELTIGEVLKYVNKDGDVLGYGHPGGILALTLIDQEIPYETIKLESFERAPAGHPCSNCMADIAQQRAEFKVEIELGGLHWHCEECGVWGIVMHDDSHGFSAGVRRASGIKPPTHAGVRFTNCKQHESEDDAKGMIH